MKIFRKIVSVIILVCIMLTLTGCGKKVTDSWKLTGGNAIAAIASISGTSALTDGSAEAVFTFEKDGTLIINMKRDDINTELIGSWTEEDDSLTINLGGESVKFSYAINGDELTLFFTLNGQNSNLVFARN